VTAPDDVAAEILARADQLVVMVWGHVHMRMAETGLSMPEAKAVMHLEEGVALSMRDLAARIHASPSNVTVTVDRLQARGLIRREDAGDRRVRSVRLTAAGVALRQRLQQRIATDHPALRGLDAEDRDMLLRVLRRLTGDISEIAWR
jgi:DNA-binding MarR family transcriptional regulator